MISGPPRLREIGIDVGGTFTDVVACWDNGAIRTTKFLSSLGLVPSELADLLKQWLGASSDSRSARVVHGTTVATNALLEGRVGRTALIATEGFRDVIELGRGIRPDPLDLRWRPVPPIVGRQLRFTVRERVGSKGEVIVPLVWDGAAQAAIEAGLAGCTAVAIALLHAYANPEHEKIIAEHIRRCHPGLFATASHEVVAEPREYERTSTTIINAALGPIVELYLSRLETALIAASLPGDIEVIQSNGGTIRSGLAKQRPVTMVESGPAAGVLAAAAIARALDEPRLIAFDMGGTTAKASLVEDFAVLEASEYYVGGGLHAGPRALTASGYVVRMPSLDVAEVGAGGGSIASVDEAGGLHVGPRSAGAAPGPACYGLGGVRATVTDANVALGYINPASIAGGLQPIDRARALAAIKEDVAGPKGLAVEDAALLIHAGANARILAALRSVTIERGRDPRERTIVAFGGSGPVHAAGIADLLGVTRVLAPFGAGVLSAAGLLAAGPAADRIEAMQVDLDEIDSNAVSARIEAMHEGLAQEYRINTRAEGAVLPMLLVRYKGQHTEIHIPFNPGGDLAAEVRAKFELEYRREFGFVVDREACEVVGLRLRLRTPPASHWQAVLSGLDASWAGATTESQERICIFADFRGPCPVLGTGQVLAARRDVRGPAIIESPDSTIVVPPGWMASIKDGLGLLLWK